MRKCAGAGGTGGSECGRLGLVFKRAATGQESIERSANEMGLQLPACIPEDANITRYDLQGTPIGGLPDESPSIVAVKNLVEIVLNGEAAGAG